MSNLPTEFTVDANVDTKYELEETDAIHRAEVIGDTEFAPPKGDVQYDVKLLFQEQLDFYYGHVKVAFNCKKLPTKDIWIDAKTTKIFQFKFNGAEATPSVDNRKIMLTGIVEGQNEIEIVYENKYQNDGTGLHKYTDPEDSREYFYTQFESFNAHKCFPCFDQPDLKANLKLMIMAPDSWKVISNEHEEEPVNIETEWNGDSPVYSYRDTSKAFILHTFQETPRISTYLYAICAGPYISFDKPKNSFGRPLRLFCRSSQTKYMEAMADYIFTWTEKGMAFYGDFFGITYPFSKYDQVFCPEFNAGAMENVGCVTYNEALIPKETPSKSRLTRLCHVLMHEMAHMWYGNLITMRWWEDLWLNESFAEYISHYCMAKGFGDEFLDIWGYFLGGKAWGYSTDQNKTTHPISVKIANTEEAETIFDGISYSKGSAVLKQLAFAIGEDPFKEGVQNYFAKYSWKNTIFDNLIESLQEVLDKTSDRFDLRTWADSWVLTAGLNELEVTFDKTEEGNITNFVVGQTAALAEFPELRHHKINVHFVNSDHKVFHKATIETARGEMINSYSDFDDLKDVQCVILNADDGGYCKTRFDSISREYLKENLNNLEDSLTRLICWRSLWDSVRDQKISAVEFLDAIVKHIPGETSTTINSEVIAFTKTAIESYCPYGEWQLKKYHELYELVVQKLKSATAAEEVAFYKDRLTWFAKNEPDVKQLVDWMQAGSTGIEHFEIGEDYSWRILKAYASLTDDAKSTIDATPGETDIVKYGKLYCEYAYPSRKQEKFMEIIEKGPAMSNYEQGNIMGGWIATINKEIMRPCANLYFDNFLNVLNNTSKEFLEKYCNYLLPGYDQYSVTVEKIRELLPQIPEGYPAVVKSLTESIDVFERLDRGRTLSQYVIDSLA